MKELIYVEFVAALAINSRQESVDDVREQCSKPSISEPADFERRI